MKNVFENKIKIAKKLISKYGRFVIWRIVRKNNLTDENKPWVTNEALTQDFFSKIAFFENTKENRESFQLSENSIPAGNFVGLLAANSEFTPGLNDLILTDSLDIYTIENINVLAPNGTDILYTLDLISGKRQEIITESKIFISNGFVFLSSGKILTGRQKIITQEKLLLSRNKILMSENKILIGKEV